LLVCGREVSAGLPSLSCLIGLGLSAGWSGCRGAWWGVSDGIAPQLKPRVCPGPVGSNWGGSGSSKTGAATTTPTDPTPPTATSPRPSSLYSGPRPTNPKPHSDWTTKRVPLTSAALLCDAHECAPLDCSAPGRPFHPRACTAVGRTPDARSERRSRTAHVSWRSSVAGMQRPSYSPVFPLSQ
jgi:hypothetical protein